MNEGIDLANLKEHDSLYIKNPTAEDFGWRFNGEMYSIRAGEEKSFSKFVVFHLAHHLATKMIVKDEEKKITPEDAKNMNAAIHLRIAQLGIYDTHERRIALYRILKRKELVEAVILCYPFKGFIGEMGEYERFMERQTQSDKKPEPPNKSLEPLKITP